MHRPCALTPSSGDPRRRRISEDGGTGAAAARRRSAPLGVSTAARRIRAASHRSRPRRPQKPDGLHDLRCGGASSGRSTLRAAHAVQCSVGLGEETSPLFRHSAISSGPSTIGRHPASVDSPLTSAIGLGGEGGQAPIAHSSGCRPERRRSCGRGEAAERPLLRRRTPSRPAG